MSDFFIKKVWIPKLNKKSENIAIKSEGIKVNNENTEIYFIFVCDPVLFLLPAEYKRIAFLNISEKRLLIKIHQLLRELVNFWHLTIQILGL